MNETLTQFLVALILMSPFLGVGVYMAGAVTTTYEKGAGDRAMGRG